MILHYYGQAVVRMRGRRFTAFFLMFLLLCPFFAADAGASVPQTVYVSSTLLDLYSNPQGIGGLAGQVSFGSPVGLIAADDRAALIRLEDGRYGYCDPSCLTISDPDCGGILMMTKCETRCYTLADPSSDLIVSAHAGAKALVRSVSPDGVWSRVEYKSGKYGYVLSSCLGTFEPNASAASLDPSGDDLRYVVTGTAVIRKKASPSASKVLTLGYGQRVTLLSPGKTWSKVTAGEKTGWCRTDSLSSEDPADEGRRAYSRLDGMYAYRLPSASSGKLRRFAMDETVLRIGILPGQKWALADLGEERAYIRIADFSDEPVINETTVYAAASIAKCYSSRSTGSKLLFSVDLGLPVTRITQYDKWSFLFNGSSYAWCLSSKLSETDPNLAEPVTVYAVKAGACVYSRPTTSSEKLKKTVHSEALKATAIGTDKKWLRVLFGEGSGYVSTSDFTLDKPPCMIGFPCYVKADHVTARKKPSSTAKKAGTVGYGTEMECLAISGKWAKVRVSGRTGWCLRASLMLDDPNRDAVTYYVSAASAIVSYPSSSPVRIAIVPQGAKVAVVAETPSGIWSRIEYENSYAYILSSVLTNEDPGEAGYTDPLIGTASATIESVIAVGVAQYGKPYVYSKEGPNSFDCSGFVRYSWKTGAGITLKRSSKDQAADNTYEKISSISNLKRGDVLFFDTSGDGSGPVDHAALYIGGNRIIHASSSAGKVIVSSLTSYYKTHFKWARRIHD